MNFGSSTSFLRRTLLPIVLGVVVVIGYRAVVDRPPAFEFARAEVDGFRVIAGSEMSRRQIDPLVGLDHLESLMEGGQQPSKPASTHTTPTPVALEGEALCRAIFGDMNVPEGTVPVAMFTDYACPFCQVQAFELADPSAISSNPIRIKWHEWAILGDRSEVAARAALAAEAQDAYLDYQHRMLRSRVVLTDDVLRIVAREIGIDGDRLLFDMTSQDVTDRLAETRQIARQFRFVGTPVIFIGRTVVEGYLSPEKVAALVALEAEQPFAGLCKA